MAVWLAVSTAAPAGVIDLWQFPRSPVHCCANEGGSRSRFYPAPICTQLCARPGPDLA